MKDEKKNGRFHDSLYVLVRCFYVVIWILIIAHFVFVAVDNNQIQEMKKEELRLSIKLLKWELGL